MAKDIRNTDTPLNMSDNQKEKLIEECKRQEESCLYTSATLFEWLKAMRRWRIFFIVVPIILGGIATWPLLNQQSGYEWLTGICALLAGITPAIYKALDFDISLNAISQHAHQYKTLQDRFRQAWRILALDEPEQFKNEFDRLMEKMDETRSSSLTPPEHFFAKAQKKIEASHYQFSEDTEQ